MICNTDARSMVYSQIVTKDPMSIGSKVIVQVATINSPIDIYVHFPFGFNNVRIEQSKC